MSDKQQNNSVELTILMPCLNESESIGICIEKARSFLIQNQVNGEILVADNGSTDDSVKIAQQKGARVVHVQQRGYGAAILGAIETSKGRYIIMGDSDDSYDFLLLMPFLEKLRAGYDIVIGNRFKGGIQHDAMPLLHRYFGNPVLSGIGNLFFHTPIKDFHCGLRGFRKDSIWKLNLQTSGMEFASEMIVKAKLMGLKLCEVPTVLKKDARSRKSHLHSWRDGWRHLRFMLIYSPRWLFLYPGIILILVGLVVGVWLISSPREVFNIVLDIHTLLYCAMAILVGFQSILFAVFTRIYAINQHLMPDSLKLKKLLDHFTLEKGVFLAILLIVSGLIGSIFTLTYWRHQSFGPLNPSQTFRIVIPSVLVVVLGCQTISASFFLSVMCIEKTPPKFSGSNL